MPLIRFNPGLRVMAGVTALFGVVLIGVVFYLGDDDGRWPIAAEELAVEEVLTTERSLSFYVPLGLQLANSVLRSRPVHYLRPFHLQERVGEDWVPIPVPKKLYSAEDGSSVGLRRCYFKFFFKPHEGDYRALLVYRYRGRWDYLQVRIAKRLPKKMRHWVLPSRADGAVWTETFSVRMDSKDDLGQELDLGPIHSDPSEEGLGGEE
jgi:hypothetical protein